jgi:hypothetical protein
MAMRIARHLRLTRNGSDRGDDVGADGLELVGRRFLRR